MATTKKAEPKGNTPASHFRLRPETIAEIEWLRTEMGLTSRADVIRVLVRQETRKRGLKRE